jgi:hypothetical protein
MIKLIKKIIKKIISELKMILMNIDKEILDVFMNSKKKTKILLDMTFNKFKCYTDGQLKNYGYLEIK